MDDHVDKTELRWMLIEDLCEMDENGSALEIVKTVKK